MQLERIEEVEAFEVDRYVLVRVRTSSGIEGLGESAYWAQPSAVAATVRALGPELRGAPAFTIDRTQQALLRATSFRGASVAAAVSAIDVALWDALGKKLEAPVHVLLGGAHRHRVRACALVWYEGIRGELEELVALAARAVREGHTALKLIPLPPEHESMSHAELVRETVRRVAAVREAIGWKVDLAIELHRALAPEESMVVIRDIEAEHPLFVEDPAPPDTVEATRELVRRARVPIATGERLTSLHEFRELLVRGRVSHVKPDVGLAGGITQLKKIAAVAESMHALVSPHNFLTAVDTAAHLHVLAAIPNAGVLEYLPTSLASPFLEGGLRVDDGHFVVPDAPGLGLRLREEMVAAHPPRPVVRRAPSRPDGSVALR